MKLEPANIICPKCGNGNYMRHLIGKGVGKLDMKCINCNSYFNFDELYKQKIAEIVKPQTNYDRIISKSPEELATLIADNIDCNICKEIHDPKYERCPGAISEEKGCSAIWLDWLKQEATE